MIPVLISISSFALCSNCSRISRHCSSSVCRIFSNWSATLWLSPERLPVYFISSSLDLSRAFSSSFWSTLAWFSLTSCLRLLLVSSWFMTFCTSSLTS